MPCYMTEDKGFVSLPMPKDITSGTCLRVSSDGSIAVGTISVHIEGTEESYYKPVLWYRNESGEYDMFEDLPYEKLGFDKRINQGVWILGITSDGLKIYGRLIDAFGMIYWPVMWERSSAQSKDWTYKILCEDYFSIRTRYVLNGHNICLLNQMPRNIIQMRSLRHSTRPLNFITTL